MVVTDMHHLICAGAVCNCILPESLKINAVCHDPDGQAEDSEKRRLTGAFSCFSSISLCQRHFSASSLFLRSPAKGTSWDTKQSSSARLKKSWELRYPVHCISLIEAPRFFLIISNLFYERIQRYLQGGALMSRVLAPAVLWNLYRVCVGVILKLEFTVQWAQTNS
jgi:hypothetical protein